MSMIYLLHRATGDAECVFNTFDSSTDVKSFIKANQSLADSLGCYLFEASSDSSFVGYCRNIRIPTSTYFAFTSFCRPLSDFRIKEGDSNEKR